jgi:hypothetical protein
VLINPSFEVASNASVQNRVAFVAEDIDAVDLIHTASCPSLRGA